MMPQGAGALSESQVAGYARQAGFTGNDLAIAVAVAHAESGFNPRAHNAKPPDNSYGLWQINMIGGLGPARRKQFGLSSNDQLYDPATNARVAFAIYKGAGRTFRDWSTYNNGSYKQYINTGVQPDAPGAPTAPGDTNTGTPAGGKWYDTINPFHELSQSLYQFTEMMRRSFILYLVVIVALVLLIIGFLILNRERAAKAAGLVAPTKVVKVAKALG